VFADTGIGAGTGSGVGGKGGKGDTQQPVYRILPYAQSQLIHTRPTPTLSLPHPLLYGPFEASWGGG